MKKINIALFFPKGSRELILRCRNNLKSENCRYNPLGITLKLSINEIDTDNCDIDKLQDSVKKCDCGIVYGDTLSKWAHDYLTKINYPILLMSAASFPLKENFIKAYPDDFTMGLMLARLVGEFLNSLSNKIDLCFLFEDSPAGTNCKKYFSNAIRLNFKERFHKYKEQAFNPNEFNLDELINFDDCDCQKLFVVYGLGGDSYRNILNELINRRKSNRQISIISDVNSIGKIDGGETPDVWVSSPLQKNKNFDFFSDLILDLQRIVVKAILFSPLDIKETLKDRIVSCSRYVETSMGVMPFISGSLFIPFAYKKNNSAQIYSLDHYRNQEISRDSIGLATARMRELVNKIKDSNPNMWRKEILPFKNEFKKRILEACFFAKKVIVFDNDFQDLDDGINLPIPAEIKKQPLVFQMSFNLYDFENTNVVRLYFCNDNSIYPESVSRTDGLSCVFAQNQNEALIKYKKEDVISGDTKAIVKGLKSESDNCKYLYYFPSQTEKARSYSGVAIYSNFKYRDAEINTIKNLIDQFFGAFNLVNYIYSIKNISIKSAIGSIMSRNGSHNIGSHVLSALSHNIGTMPDDRMLYQYIQHRMDYIATATTEFPSWRQPTFCVNGFVKEFLSQKHLLNYIARSEGLKAYQFQNPTIGCNSEQPQTIRIHARRLKDLKLLSDAFLSKRYYIGDDCIENSFILYLGDKGFQNDGKWDAHLEKDLELAIPNGDVGRHALFTIIENVIRNAAKHYWSKLPDKTKKNLDVYLDFQDNPEAGVVEFIIWTDGRISKKLCEDLSEKMGRKFISEDGQLQKDNWGFAEMRISAGYLKGAKIGTIGGLDGSQACLDLIRPVLVCFNEDDSKDNDEGCLGFRFDVFKPRELLILTEKQVKGCDEKIQWLKQYGIWIMSKEEAAKERSLTFSYVLLENFDGIIDVNALKLPFRIIFEGEVKNISNQSIKLFPKMPKEDSVISKIYDILNNITDENSAKIRADELLKKIYCRWVLHLKEIARNSKRIISNDKGFLPVVIDAADDSPEGSGKGLFSTPDFMRFVLENTLNAALRSYLAQCKDDRIVIDAWNYILKMRPRPVLPIDKLIEYGSDVTSMLAKQINNWYIKAPDGKVISCLVSNSRKDPSPNLKGFSNFLQNTILTQVDSFLSKYEEKIVTLPESFSMAKSPNSWEKPFEWKNAGISLLFTKDDDKRHSDGKVCLAFLRHYNFVSEDKERENKEPAYKKLIENQNKLYLEPLSGSQSYLNAMKSLANHIEDDTASGYCFLSSLIETGLQRVLIIDERMYKFVQDHADVKLTFDHIGVSTMCDETEEIINIFNDYKLGNSFSVNSSVSENEIVIIHMGIIDKLLPNHECKEEVAKFISYLKRNLRYVVITTGRGTPSNLPDDARVLPFSAIESTMFKKYPEKLILIDNVMNVLPVIKEGN